MSEVETAPLPSMDHLNEQLPDSLFEMAGNNQFTTQPRTVRQMIAQQLYAMAIFETDIRQMFADTAIEQPLGGVLDEPLAAYPHPMRAVALVSIKSHMKDWATKNKPGAFWIAMLA